MRVALADDSALFREGLAALLRAAGLEVVLQAASGQELLDQVDQLLQIDELGRVDELGRAGPLGLDAVVVDIRMPPTYTEEGLDTADALRLRTPEVAVLVLSTYAETAYAVRVFGGGASRRGYLLKDALVDPETLRRCLERLQRGGSVLDPSIVARLMGATRRKAALDVLTSGRRTILRMLAEGCQDGEIAEAVNLGPDEARAEIDEVLRVLGILSADRMNRLVRVLSWLRSET